MNFLAHLYLSQHPPELMVGNFIGDFVKGSSFDNYDLLIQKGIILHREIDAFTDDHDIVKKSKKLLVDRYRHYAAVIVDMFYDHFLASNWDCYHETPLQHFSQQSYNTLLSFEETLPEKAQYMLPFMAKHDWLSSYSTVEGIGRALSGLSRRSRFESHMEKATEDLLLDYDIFKEDFTQFFPQLVSHISRWKNTHLNL